MKIRDAKQAYSAQLDFLREKKQTLSRLLKDQEEGKWDAPAIDRVELTREMSEVSAQYEAAQDVMEGILAKEYAVRSGEAAKQQSETLAKEAEEIVKMMEVFRRISSGAKVPPSDEKKLMEFSHELYMAAKSAAMLAQQNDKEYDSLWEDEEDNPEEQQDAQEIAANTEISVPMPEMAAVRAAEAE